MEPNPDYIPIKGPFTCRGYRNSWMIMDASGDLVEHIVARGAKKMAKERVKELNNPKPVGDVPRYRFENGEGKIVEP